MKFIWKMAEFNEWLDEIPENRYLRYIYLWVFFINVVIFAVLFLFLI